MLALIANAPNGIGKQAIMAACKGDRPNHVGIALQRLRRAGQIEDRNGIYHTITTTQEQRAA